MLARNGFKGGQVGSNYFQNNTPYRFGSVLGKIGQVVTPSHTGCATLQSVNLWTISYGPYIMDQFSLSNLVDSRV